MERERKGARKRLKKRDLHELLCPEIVRSETIRIAFGVLTSDLHNIPDTTNIIPRKILKKQKMERKKTS